MQKVVESGDFEIEVGAASNDIRAKGKITVFDSQQARKISSLLGTKANKSKMLHQNQKKQDNKAINQFIKVSGIIRNVQAGVMSGVVVSSKFKGNNAITNDGGMFTIYIPANDTLIVSKKGYQTKEVPVNNNRVINISISQSSF